MTTTCVIQARMGSNRLPGKVLEPLAGRPMLSFMLDRLRDIQVDHLVVATSDLGRDDPVEVVAKEAGVEVVRGSESDVLSRFIAALDIYPADNVIRLTADCPLIDAGLVNAVLATHLARGADYTSNVLPRTFPKGLDVEVIRSDVLRVANREALEHVEREHVTPFIYRRPERFALANHTGSIPLGKEWWTVDTREDLTFVRSVVAKIGDSDSSWQTILRLVGRRATTARGELVLRPATLDDSSIVLAWRNEAAAVRWSTTKRSIAVEEHASWFAATLQNAGKRIFIGEVDGARVGTVRVDVECGIGTVSIAVDPQRRRMGMGLLLIRALQAELLGDCQVVGLRAIVHEANAGSTRIFERSGFAPSKTDNETGFTELVCPRSFWVEAPVCR